MGLLERINLVLWGYLAPLLLIAAAISSFFTRNQTTAWLSAILLLYAAFLFIRSIVEWRKHHQWDGKKLLLAGLFVALPVAALVTVNSYYSSCLNRMGPGAKLAGCDLAGQDLAGEDLREADLSAADLSGADLAGARLEGAVLQGANLSEANLEGAGLEGVTLDSAILEGVSGLTDEALSGALDTGIEELSFHLTQRHIRLQSREAIADGLQEVCKGQGTQVAGIHSLDHSFHPAISFRGSGTRWEWSEPIPQFQDQQWEPMALRFCELVVCWEQTEQVELGRCPYTQSGIVAEVVVPRYQYRQTVTVRSARTGEVIETRTFSGSEPVECPEFLHREKPFTFHEDGGWAIHGAADYFPDLEEWLDGFINSPG